MVQCGWLCLYGLLVGVGQLVFDGRVCVCVVVVGLQYVVWCGFGFYCFDGEDEQGIWLFGLLCCCQYGLQWVEIVQCVGVDDGVEVVWFIVYLGVEFVLDEFVVVVVCFGVFQYGW